MKSTGIVRKVDELGRVVLPIELRKTFNIEEKDGLEIYVDADSIILKKHESGCIFCGEVKGVKDFKGKNICPNCSNELKNNKSAAEKAQIALNQLSKGKKTTNQIRAEFGLNPINDNVSDKLITKA